MIALYIQLKRGVPIRCVTMTRKKINSMFYSMKILTKPGREGATVAVSRDQEGATSPRIADLGHGIHSSCLGDTITEQQ